MDFKDQVKQLSARIEKMLPQINTEEATKTSIIMPFIQILGYDVFNPFEVNPEYVADIGIKKGEKVDYEVPRALETIEVEKIPQDYKNSAQLAKKAGFDGIEIHSANGYLLDQFL